MKTNDFKSNTLSKDLLYADIAGSCDPNRRGKFATEEKKIVSFLQDVSSSYSSKLKQSTIEQKLFQRSVTLFGAGIGNNAFGSARQNVKRRREEKCERRKTSRKMLQKSKFNINYVKLQESWIEYSKNLVRICRDPSRFPSVFVKAELVGAVVVIEKCSYCPTWKGKKGIIVSVSKCVLSIAVSKKAKYLDLNSGKLVHIQVPKIGTQLDLSVQLPISRSSKGKSCGTAEPLERLMRVFLSW